MERVYIKIEERKERGKVKMWEKSWIVPFFLEKKTKKYSYLDTLRINGNHIRIHTLVRELTYPFLIFFRLRAAVIGYHERILCIRVISCR